MLSSKKIYSADLKKKTFSFDATSASRVARSIFHCACRFFLVYQSANPRPEILSDRAPRHAENISEPNPPRSLAERHVRFLLPVRFDLSTVSFYTGEAEEGETFSPDCARKEIPCSCTSN